MKIPNLNKITIADLKNYDWKSVKDRFLGNPIPIICALAFVITATAILLTYRTHKSSTKTQKIKLQELRKKTKALKKFETTQKQYADFLSGVPKAISENKLIEMLSEIAIKRDVQIISFSPASKSYNNYITLTSVEITIASESYTDTIRFMHDIENSPYSVRVGKWSGILKSPTQISQRFLRGSNRQASANAIQNEYVEASIEIETVEFKK